MKPSPAERKAEAVKYDRSYKDPAYRMGEGRLRGALAELGDKSGSLLDVGCGRGELVAEARKIGLEAEGLDPVADLKPDHVGHANELPFPDQHFDYVTCLDVLEHLLRGDDDAAVRECYRVSRRGVLISVANFSDVWHGVEMHVNRRPYDEWGALFRIWTGGVVRRLDDIDGAARFWIEHPPGGGDGD